MEFRKNWAWFAGVGCSIAVIAACTATSSSDPNGVTPAGDDTASDDDATGDDTTATVDGGDTRPASCGETLDEIESPACTACLTTNCKVEYGACFCADDKYAEPVEGQSSGYACSDYASCVNSCRQDTGGDGGAEDVQTCIDICKDQTYGATGGDPYNSFEACTKSKCATDCTFQGE